MLSVDTAIKYQEESQVQNCRLRQLLTESTYETNKENHRGENVRKEPSNKYKMNMLMISREGS